MLAAASHTASELLVYVNASTDKSGFFENSANNTQTLIV